MVIGKGLAGKIKGVQLLVTVFAASFLVMPFAWATEDDYQTNLSQRITNLRKKV